MSRPFVCEGSHKQIVFTELNVAKLLDAQPNTIGEYDIVVKNVVSTISAGTEKANITGDLNVNGSRPQEEYAHFPRMSGYSSAGIVIDKGEKVTKFEIGDRVAIGWGLHKSYNVIHENMAVKIPDNISFEDAAVTFIATFPMAAVRKTAVEIGNSVLVMGLGILGILAVNFARLSGGTPVIAADPIKERRELALKFGADFALDPLEEGFAEKVKELTGGGVNAAIEVTGVGAGLETTLDCMAKFGKVALLGCTRDRNFTIDYYRKVHFPGISLIGAHTNARPDLESHPNYFTHIDDMKAYLKLCELGRIDVKSIIGETHSPVDCEDVYHRLVFDKEFPVLVQFNWRTIK